MPEGHVIHRLAAELNQHYAGHDVEVSSPQGRFDTTGLTHLNEAVAHGKHLFIVFAGDIGVVHVHLGLIGKFTFSPSAPPKGQVRMRIDDGETAADLRGPQWCRRMAVPEMDAILGQQGADPLHHDDPAKVLSKVARSRKSIGELLMDQKLFAGVGNIYRAETLFRLRISPFQPGNELHDDELRAIWDDLVEIMAIGVERGRIDTVRDEHLPEAMGREPRVDDHGGEVYVYRREGLPCYVCGRSIRRVDMEGRNLFYCPGCQRKKRRVAR